MTNFIGIETGPALPINSTGKAQNVSRAREINESVADIATIAEIHPQVQEIKTTAMTFIN